MEKLKFKRIGFLIAATLLFAIGMQAWRMVSQFEVIRDRLFADVQQSLDNAVENYFAELAKTDVIALTDISGQKAFLRDDSIPERSITRISIDQKNSSNGLLDQLTGNEKLFQTLEKSSFYKKGSGDGNAGSGLAGQKGREV